ncbi:sodium/glutamate symporter [Pararobbsia alpina]|uniref:sodium/glutamate symporter n=1 Tax=Pararobbsia alpina TaxID=621374 RepID=UPI00158241CE|nr:sodium/glutamate symporter [Pararobbsia alpina]
MSLDTLETLIAAALVLLLGRQILPGQPLRTYSVPEPVVGCSAMSASDYFSRSR